MPAPVCLHRAFFLIHLDFSLVIHSLRSVVLEKQRNEDPLLLYNLCRWVLSPPANDVISCSFSGETDQMLFKTSLREAADFKSRAFSSAFSGISSTRSTPSRPKMEGTPMQISVRP